MKIKKIQDKLEFDVEAQALPCNKDCAQLRWKEATSDLFWNDPYFRTTCYANMYYDAQGNLFW